MASDPLREAIERALPCFCGGVGVGGEHAHFSSCPAENRSDVHEAVAPLLAAERERREAAEGALRGLVDLVEAWMNGIIKRSGIEWESPADHPPALRVARAALAASDGEDAP